MWREVRIQDAGGGSGRHWSKISIQLPRATARLGVDSAGCGRAELRTGRDRSLPAAAGPLGKGRRPETLRKLGWKLLSSRLPLHVCLMGFIDLLCDLSFPFMLIILFNHLVVGPRCDHWFCLFPDDHRRHRVHLWLTCFQKRNALIHYFKRMRPSGRAVTGFRIRLSRTPAASLRVVPAGRGICAHPQADPG